MKHILTLFIVVLFLSGCSSSDTPVTPVDKSLILHLDLNDNTNDKSIYSEQGIIDSASSFNPDRFANGTGAALFDSTETYLRVPNSTLLDTVTKITLSAWIKPVSFRGVGNSAIIHKGYLPWGPPYYQYHLGITGDRYPTVDKRATFLFAMSINGQYTYTLTPANVWTPGSWFHVVATYDGDSLKLYVNGDQKSALYAKGTVNHFGEDLYVGKINGAIAYTGLPAITNTPGTMDEIRVYNRALTGAEVKSLYQQK